MHGVIQISYCKQKIIEMHTKTDDHSQIVKEKAHLALLIELHNQGRLQIKKFSLTPKQITFMWTQITHSDQSSSLNKKQLIAHVDDILAEKKSFTHQSIEYLCNLLSPENSDQISFKKFLTFFTHDLQVEANQMNKVMSPGGGKEEFWRKLMAQSYRNYYQIINFLNRNTISESQLRKMFKQIPKKSKQFVTTQEIHQYSNICDGSSLQILQQILGKNILTEDNFVQILSISLFGKKQKLGQDKSIFEKRMEQKIEIKREKKTQKLQYEQKYRGMQLQGTKQKLLKNTNSNSNSFLSRKQYNLSHSLGAEKINSNSLNGSLKKSYLERGKEKNLKIPCSPGSFIKGTGEDRNYLNRKKLRTQENEVPTENYHKFRSSTSSPDHSIMQGLSISSYYCKKKQIENPSINQSTKKILEIEKRASMKLMNKKSITFMKNSKLF